MLSWLWVSCALLWPQASTQFRNTTGEARQWVVASADPLKLFCDLTASDLKKSEDPSTEDGLQPDAAPPPGAVLSHISPEWLLSGTIGRGGKESVCTVILGLPLSRGPPARA
jgi:hypothetical protein